MSDEFQFTGRRVRLAELLATLEGVDPARVTLNPQPFHLGDAAWTGRLYVRVSDANETQHGGDSTP